MISREGRTLVLDMDSIHSPDELFLKSIQDSKEKFNNPWCRLKYTNIEELKAKIDAYFNSCYGAKYYKGKPVLDIDGNPVIGQVEPFTISGLARALGVFPATLRTYEAKAKAGLIPVEIYDIIQDARLRIEDYVEKRIYDRDGASGARFVLESSFGWITKKDRKEVELSKKRMEISENKLKLLQAAAEAKNMDDKEFVVSILRASNDD